MSTSFAPSVGGTLSDLDGFSLAGDNSYLQMSSTMFGDPSTDFGFDPPGRTAYPMKTENYSPSDNNSPFTSEFDFDPALISKQDPMSTYPTRALELDALTSRYVPHNSTVVSRYGQVTPPRSNSEASTDKVTESKPSRQRRSTKGSVKDETAQASTNKSTTTGRKRRNTRKESIASISSPEDDDKRKQSLEKNRLAAAKCRINKKEKTEQLQRDSHDKAMQNSFLRSEIIRLKDEVQRMNALLLSHANCQGCKSPEDIQKHLQELGNDFFARHMSEAHPDFSGFPDLPADMQEMEHDHYFSPATDSNLMHPPLPDFDREPDFDVSTPMHTD